ncbi:hypothetical protein ABT099_23435 [Streptomyces prasinus]|uniref:hypothetical protein n=1 Tax=Streptomyces prasinus TaxID=67345 RepID=UPI003321E19B
MSDQLEARSIAAQLIHQAIQRIDCKIAADHIIDTMGEDVDVDALAFAAENAAHAATVHLAWEKQESWQIQRGGEALHTVTGRDEAQTVGQLLIRAETGDHTVAIRWVCAVCDSEEDTCPECWDGEPSVLVARGILTEQPYELERVTT